MDSIAHTIPEELKPYAESLTGPAARLVKLTRNLTDLIARETALLKGHQPREAQKLHGEKSKIMSEYKTAMNQLQSNEHILGPKDSGERKFIRFLTDQLREVLRDHARIVLRLKSVAEGLVKSVGEEVAKQTRPVVGYGQNAGYQIARSNRPMSISLNEVI
jgi:hypothetical protein